MNVWIGIGAAAGIKEIHALRFKRNQTLSGLAGRHPYINTAAVIVWLVHTNWPRVRRQRALPTVRH